MAHGHERYVEIRPTGAPEEAASPGKYRPANETRAAGNQPRRAWIYPISSGADYPIAA